MKTTPITLFIHGTLPPKAVCSLPVLRRFFACPQGMTPVAQLPDSQIKDLLMLLNSVAPEEFPASHSYAFGWSGLLKPTARLTAAQELMVHLTDLQEEFPETPISLITHSHGGNVALRLPELTTELSLAQLILLACPVQKETAGAVNSPLFTKVYSLHSHTDLLQIADPQGARAVIETLTTHGLELTLQELTNMKPLFSERHFAPDSAAIQLNVRYPRRELFHIEFLLPKFMKALPSLLQQLRGHTKTKTKQDDLTSVLTDD